MALTPEQIRTAHLIDNHEQVRTAALRSVTLTMELLGTALDAIDGNSPAVTREYVDRALLAAKRASAALTGDS